MFLFHNNVLFDECIISLTEDTSKDFFSSLLFSDFLCPIVSLFSSFLFFLVKGVVFSFYPGPCKLCSRSWCLMHREIHRDAT